MKSTIAKLKFPTESVRHKYNLIHFRFFTQYAKIAGVEIELVPSDDRVFIPDDQLIFSCMINDQQVIVDYADHSTRNWRHLYPSVPYFKFQTTKINPRDIIPLGPPMVGVKRIGTRGATMREYNHVRYHYKCTPGKTILCKQLPNGAAIERRNLVHQLLVKNFESVDISADSDQIDFWRAHERCLAAVCVPGATNNMVDRGHIELMGLGVCTVSPKLVTLFPQYQELVPNYHYIQCADDYSDLVDKLRHIEANLDLCRSVGKNARRFYEEYYTPECYWQWILGNLQ
jgi:hypothetical protein